MHIETHSSDQHSEEVSYSFTTRKKNNVGTISERLLNPGVLSYDVPDSICDYDCREQITNTIITPFSGICQLISTFEGQKYIGTGWLCYTNNSKYEVIVTAGHCVYAKSLDKYAESVVVIPARNGNERPYGTYEVSSGLLKASKRWISSGAITDDYGVVLIPKNQALHNYNMWVASDSELDGRYALNSGYPGDKLPFGSSWMSSGPIDNVEREILNYMNDTYGGQSGSPVLTVNNDSTIVSVGIHAYGGCPNRAVRITETVRNEILYDLAKC
ncbi:MAG: hypothetical protein G8D88_14990 [gamma proteobacterium symbiont of Ctena orbiculata]